MAPSSFPAPGSGGTVVEPKLAVARTGVQLAGAVLVAIMLFGGFAGAPVLFFLALVILAGAGLFFRETLVAAFRWHGPQLVLPRHGLELGGEIEVIYRRRPRRVTDIASCHISTELTCEERVEYRQGTTTRTDTSEVFKANFSGEGEGTVNGLHAVVTLHIPTHAGAPTLKLHHNEIRWWLETRVSGPRLPKDNHRFEIEVVPVLAAPESSAGIQDS